MSMININEGRRLAGEPPLLRGAGVQPADRRDFREAGERPEGRPATAARSPGPRRTARLIAKVDHLATRQVAGLGLPAGLSESESRVIEILAASIRAAAATRESGS